MLTITLAFLVFLLAYAQAQPCDNPSLCDFCPCPGFTCPITISPGEYIYASEPCSNCTINYEFNAGDNRICVYVMSIRDLENFNSHMPLNYYEASSYTGQDASCGATDVWGVQYPPGGGLGIVFQCTNEIEDCVFRFDYKIYDGCSMECRNFMRGNGYCNSVCNNEWCGYDDGDCETSTQTAIDDARGHLNAFITLAYIYALLIMLSLK